MPTARTDSANDPCSQGFPLGFDIDIASLTLILPGPDQVSFGFLPAKGCPFYFHWFILSLALDQCLSLLHLLQGLPAGFMIHMTLVLVCTAYGTFSTKTRTLSGKHKWFDDPRLCFFDFQWVGTANAQLSIFPFTAYTHYSNTCSCLRQ